MAIKVVLVAACALVDPDGRVLLARRPEGKPMAGLWEFPGGKIESGERPEETLIRELREDRDTWRTQAQTLLLTSERKPSFWKRLFG